MEPAAMSGITIATPFSPAARQQLLQAVDYGLLALGQIPRETFYNRIHTTHGLPRDEIPDKLERFHDALQNALGAGTRVIENLIAKNFYGRLGLSFGKNESWTLIDYVLNANSSPRCPSYDCSDRSGDYSSSSESSPDHGLAAANRRETCPDPVSRSMRGHAQ